MTDLEMMERTFQQIQEGWDIPTPQGMLRIKGADAANVLPGMPYSLLKNLAHAVYWQDLWLGALEGKKRPPNMEVWKNDWREPDSSEWESLRKRFVDGIQEARDFCGPRFEQHQCETDEKALNTLIAIAIHASYHMGQMNLLKRAGKKKEAS